MILQSSAAHAAATCASGFADKGKATGAVGMDNWVNGARADIERTPVPDFCTTGSATEADSLVALVGTGSSDGDGQIGYETTNVTGARQTYSFAFYLEDTGHNGTLTTWADPGSGAQHTYSVHRDDSSHDLNLNDNGVTKLSSSWDFHNQWSGSKAFWYEDADNKGTDIFGTATNKTDFNNTDLKRQDNSWNNPDYGQDLNDGYCWTNSNVNTQGVEFHAWTDPISHTGC
jgi:hypothetical protein